MAAGVVESSQLSITPAYQEHRHTELVEHAVIAGFAQPFLGARADPGVAPDVFHLERMEVLTRVATARDLRQGRESRWWRLTGGLVVDDALNLVADLALH